MSTKDVLQKASEHLKAQELLKKDVLSALACVKSAHADLNKHIQAKNMALNKAEQDVRACVAGLSKSLSKDAFAALDASRAALEKVSASCDVDSDLKKSSDLQYEISDLEDVLKRVS